MCRYLCVRLSWDGEQLHQLCDPNEDVGGVQRTTGVVRAAVEEFWNDLKRAHFIDRQTALLTVTATLSNNNIGLRFSSRWMFEFTTLSGILSSYFTETLLTNAELLEQREQWLFICLAIVCWFAALEMVELLGELRESGAVGIVNYISSMLSLIHI